MTPGSTSDTPTLLPINSVRNASVRPTSANLLAQYPPSGEKPRRPASEATLTMWPPESCCCICFTAACMTCSAPNRFTSSMRCRSAGSMSTTFAGSRTPALLTTTSTLPKRCTALRKQAATAVGLVTSVATESASAPDARAWLATLASAAARRATSTTLAPARGERERRLAADAARGARDEDGLAVEAQGWELHAPSLARSCDGRR